MATISIGAAWEETIAFVKREGALLFPVALAFLALPMLLLDQIAPEQMQAMPGTPGSKAAVHLSPSFIFSLLLAALVAMLGMLAIYALSLRPGISVGEALQLAVRRLPVLIGSVALILLGMGGVLFLLSMIAALLVPLMGIAQASTVMALAALPVILFAGVRLILLYVVVLQEPAGVMDTIKRSWRMTEGQFWRLFGFVLGFILLIIVAQLVASSVFGVAGRLIGGAGLAKLFAGLALAIISGVLQVYYLVMTSRIYRQLRC